MLLITEPQLFYLALFMIGCGCCYWAGFKTGTEQGSAVGLVLMKSFIETKVGEAQMTEWLETDRMNFEKWLKREMNNE